LDAALDLVLAAFARCEIFACAMHAERLPPEQAGGRMALFGISGSNGWPGMV
jgi:hypothetical protein